MDLATALKTDHHIVRDIAARYARYGKISDAQKQLVLRLAREVAERSNEVTVAAPVSDRKVTFTGKVMSVKIHDTRFGSATKMTVKVTTPNGVWLAWGTVPAAILASLNGYEDRHAALRGATVEVTTTLTPGRDAHFALMSRPTGRVVALAPAQNVQNEAAPVQG